MALTKFWTRLFSLAILAVVGISNFTFGQESNSNTPYSRFGIGDMFFQGYTSNRGMGGLGIATYDVVHPSVLNPASYAAIKLTTYEIGLNSKQSWLKDQNETSRRTNSNIQNIAISFPVTKSMGIGIGILPYSDVGYSINAKVDSGWAKWEERYRGEGGLNRVFLNTGYQINKRLNVGLGLNWMFGDITNYKEVFLPDSLIAVNTGLRNSYSINDINFNGGVQYTLPLKNNRSMILGLTYDLPTTLNASKNFTAYRFALTGSGVIRVRDTIQHQEGVKGSLNLPGVLGLGWVYRIENKLTAGIDFKMQNWSNYSLFGQKDSLKNSFYIAAGVEYIPNLDEGAQKGMYYKQVKYRAGFRYNQSNVSLRNTNLSESVVSLGLSLPQRRNFSSIDMAVEFGKMGTIKNNLIQDNFIRFNLGFTLADKWFMKRKYD